jgi:hypothetical protein
VTCVSEQLSALIEYGCVRDVRCVSAVQFFAVLPYCQAIPLTSTGQEGCCLVIKVTGIPLDVAPLLEDMESGGRMRTSSGSTDVRTRCR